MLVGSNEQPFLVHTQYICKTSKFFAAACLNGWKEDRERTIHLPEVDPQLFQAYLHWIYTTEVDLDLPEPYKEGYHRARDAQAKLLEFYILADFVKDVRLRNRIMQKFAESLDGCKRLPSLEIYEDAFEQLPPCSPLRRMLVDVMMRRMRTEYFAQTASRLPRDLLQEMAIKFMERRTKLKSMVSVADYLESEDEDS